MPHMPDNWLDIARWIMEPILHPDDVREFIAKEMDKEEANEAQ